MLIKIAIKGLIKKKFLSILIIISIAVNTFAILNLLSIENGVRNASFKELSETTPLTQITVSPKSTEFSLNSFLTEIEGEEIKEESLDKIKAINGVKSIYTETQFNNFASLELNILGSALITDTLVFGIEPEFFKDELENFKILEKNTEPYPMVIPEKILDIYNLAIAIPKGLPSLSEKDLIGKTITLYPNYSSFFPSINNKLEKIRFQIVGSSKKVNLIGITINQNLLNELNEKYANSSKPKYTQIHVETNSAEITEKVANKIEELGFNTNYLQKNLTEVESKFNYLKIALAVIAFIISISAIIAIISNFLNLINDEKKQIGLFRALGARKTQIIKIILIKSFILANIAIFIALIASILSSKLLNNYIQTRFSDLTIIPSKISLLQLDMIIYAYIISISIALISSLIPALNASKIQPSEILK